MKQVAVILNAAAGAFADGDGKKLSARIPELFRKENVDAAVSWVCGDETVGAAREAMGRGTDAVVAAGGDGTINSIAGQLSGTDIPLGVLALGTRNHFAKDLNIPQDIEAAVQLIAHGRPQQIDVAEVNGHIFVNNSSIGAYPRAVELRDMIREHSGHSKQVAMMLAAFQVLSRRPWIRVRLDWEGQSTFRRTPFVFVGNNIYSLKLFEDEFRPRLDGGQLCVLAARCTGLWGLLRLGWRALCDRLSASRDFDSWCTEKIQVVATHRHHVRVAVDGEVIRLQSPLRFRIRPGALRVIAGL